MDTPEVFLSMPAMSMLGKWDRYSRQGILEDFKRKLSGPEKDTAKALEDFQCIPVLDGDYQVVWKPGPKDQINVVAVVKGAPKSAKAVKDLISDESLSTTTL